MPISPVATLWHKEIACPGINGLGQEIQIRRPDFQVAMQQFVNSTSTIPLNNVPNNLLASVSTQPCILQAGTSTRIMDVQIRITLTLSTAGVVFVPTPYWFQRLDITQTTGNPMPLASMYGDSQHQWIMTAIPQGDLYGKLRLMNYNTTQKGYIVNPQYLQLNQAGDYNFYYYVSNTFINQFLGILWASAQTNLVFNFTPDSTVIASGSGTYSIKSINVIMQSQNLIPRDLQQEVIDAIQLPSSTIYLDPIVVKTGLATSVTAGQVFNIDCSNITGRIAFVAVYIRVQGSTNTNFGYIKNCLSIGPNGTIDFQDASGTSLISNNGPWYGDYAQYEIADDQGLSDAYSRAGISYILPFCMSVPRAFNGTESGFLYQTNNTHNRVSIVAASPVSEVYTITTGAFAATAGKYRFYIESTGDISSLTEAGTIGALDFAATTTQMIAALANMQTLQALGVQTTNITINNALNTAGATKTITIAYPRGNGLRGDTIQILGDALVINALTSSPTSAVTTPGISGLATGTYDVNIVAWVYREMVMAEGVLTMQIQGAPIYPPPKKAEALTAIQVLPASAIAGAA
jgi:hypothetical protein